MQHALSRRHFIQSSVLAGAWAGLEHGLPNVTAEEAKLKPSLVRMDPSIEPLVRLLETTPRQQLLEEIGSRIRKGLTYREVLAALLLAGVRNVQPRPVGFKFHSVLVVNSAHLASLSSPDSDRWLPIFWALDYFKSAQLQDEREGDWTMRAVDEASVPPSHRARKAFIEAMDNWDVTAADAAVAGLTRSAGSHEIFELFSRYGSRDFRDIGHKAIFVANGWRTLQCIGWQHAEPVLRSLAYALLAHEGGNPAQRDANADRHGRRNLELIRTIQSSWRQGSPSHEATLELVQTLRGASSEQAVDQVIQLLNRGCGPQTVWDALFAAAGEMLVRRPGIVSLHALTTTNAMHYAFQATGSDQTRRFLLLQNVAFLPQFREARGELNDRSLRDLKADDLSDPQSEAQIFAELSRDRLSAARLVHAYVLKHPQPKKLIDTARRLIFYKGTNSHDYKFSSAVLEDYYHISPAWRAPFLAASVFNLRGSGDKDNSLVQRASAAL